MAYHLSTPADTRKALGISTPTITTTGTTPAVLAMLPAPPGVILATCRIVARNTATNDAAAWNGQVAAKIAAGGGALFGDASFGLFSGDSALSACTIVATASGSGLTITVTGIAGATIAWAADFSSILEA